MNNFQIKRNDRTLIVGQTESGKTFVAERLLEPAERLVVFDAKGNLKERFHLQEMSRKNRRKLEKGGPIRLQIPQPTMSLNDLPLYYEEVIEELMYYGNLTVYMDETSRVTGYTNNVLPQFGRMYTQGREVNQVGVVASIQRPSRMPMILFSEAQHFLAFRLNLDADRKRMAETMGETVRTPILDKHGFYYYNFTMREPVYYESYPNS